MTPDTVILGLLLIGFTYEKDASYRHIWTMRRKGGETVMCFDKPDRYSYTACLEDKWHPYVEKDVHELLEMING